MPQPNPPNPIPLAIVIVLAVIAISGSEKKLRSALVILGWTVAGFAVGTGIGFATGSPGAAGLLAGVMTLIMGAGASIKKMMENRKSKR